MKKVNTLNMTITNEIGWFAFTNENMDPKTFNAIVEEIDKTFVSLYGVKGAEAYINKSIDENNNLNVKIAQEKVPHIIKSLVQSPYQEIEFNLTGVNPQKEVINRTIRKPFTASEVTELIKCYHSNKTTNANTEEQKNIKRR